MTRAPHAVGRRAQAAAYLYQRDLAYVQHAGFGGVARGAAPGLLATLGGGGTPSGLVVDLGCGDGTWLRALSDAGYDALGVDASPELLQIARRTAPAARLERANVRSFRWPACAAATAIGEVLSYRSPGCAGNSGLAPFFRRAFRALEPGGRLIFDLLVPPRGHSFAQRGWRAGDDWAVLVDVQEDRERSRLTRDITVFRRRGASYRRSHERHRAAIDDRQTIARELREAGFRVRVSRRYGAFELLPGRLAFFARKPG
ncbi:MAG: class I SAM-dependent methyltransferase [Proteobacteria bacterium]|nr:class I SAM-dependent methyltransferase [Pseudomonadota bacterium]